MTNDASDAARAGARAYEALHVPALFQEWVGPVLDAAGVRPVQTVLDVACGTGVLAYLRGWLPLMGIHLDEETIRDILNAADREMAHLVSGGAIFDSPARLISGKKPAV